MVKKLDHIGIAVKDLEGSVERWKDLFGLKVRRIEEIKERNIRIAQLDREGSPSIELISSLGPGSTVEKFIGDRGEGIHHISFEVEDIRSSLEKFREKGIRFVQDEPQKGAEQSLIAFIHPRHLNGVLIELKEKSKNSKPDD